MENKGNRYAAVLMTNNLWTLFLAGVLVVMIIGCNTITARCETKDDMGNAENEYYDEAEKTYIRNAEKYLDGHGCRNSGITMTSVSDAGERHYTVEIHSDTISRMDDAERGSLEENISSNEFGDGKTDFTYVLY